jgi:hypothetical protein
MISGFSISVNPPVNFSGGKQMLEGLTAKREAEEDWGETNGARCLEAAWPHIQGVGARRLHLNF